MRLDLDDEEDEDEEDEDEEEDDDEEDDEEDDDAAAAWNHGRKLFRPVFRSKEQRSTLREAEERAEEEERARAAAAAAAAERALESRALVAEQLAREEREAAAREEEEEAGRPDDTDRPEEEEADLEAWKLRELRRLKRDAEAGAAEAAEAAETERRRRLTDEERAREDAALEAAGLKVFRKDKERMNFLQKYYHKGAFYMDEGSVADKAADVRARSYAAPTGADRYDRSQLPEAMQVKNFGRRGRTKWTHLAAEDTSAALQKDEYYRLAPAIAERVERGRAGVRGGVDFLQGRGGSKERR